MLDSSHPDFATRVLRTCNWLAYLEAGIEAGPQMFLQMGIIIRLGFCSQQLSQLKFATFYLQSSPSFSTTF